MNDVSSLPSFEPPNAEEIRRVRLGIWQKGYAPLPVETGGKSCYFEGWPARARAGEFASPEYSIDPRAASTGIACGGLRGFDYDIDEPTVMAAVLEAANEAGLPCPVPTRRRENSPRILELMRAADGAPGKRVLVGAKGKIEVLGHGQMFVAHGLHPSGAAYQWNDGEPFPECLPPRDELPIVTEEQITAFFELAASIIEAESPGRNSDDQTAHVPNPEKQAPIGDVAAALAVIPNDDAPWDAWRRIGLAAWAASSGSDEGLEAWRTWSAKSSKHDDGTFEAAWAEITRSPPDQLGFGTLVHLARAAAPGWCPPSWQAAREADATAAFGAVPLAAEVPAGAGGALVTVPGFQPGVVATKPPLPLRFADEIRPMLDANELVQGLIPEQSLGVVFGPSNVGKSFWMLDLALCIAAGRPWNERRVERRGVTYIALEGGALFNNRAAAWMREHAVDPVGLPFAVVPAAVDLHDPAADTDRLIEAVRAAATRMQMPVGLIVIDTLSRAMAGGDENSPAGMGCFVANSDRIRAATASAVFHVHHLGKDVERGARGHSSLRAAIDVEIQIAATDGQHTATVTKSRDLPTGGALGFRLKTLTLGVNRYGEPVTSCVVEHTQAAARPLVKPKPLPAQAAIVLERLRAAVAAQGEPLPLGGGFPAAPTRGVKHEAWRAAAYGALGHQTPDTRRRAFNRAADELTARGLIGTHEGFVWPAAAGPETPAFAAPAGADG